MLPLISMDKIVSSDYVNFDDSRCRTTKDALKYARHLYDQRATSKPSHYQYVELMNNAQQAMINWFDELDYRKQTIQGETISSVENRYIIAQPAICSEGRFCVAPLNDHTVQFYDYLDQESTMFPVDAELTQFVGQRLVSTGKTLDGASYIAISKDMLTVFASLHDFKLQRAKNEDEKIKKEGLLFAKLLVQSPAIALATTQVGNRCASAHIKKDTFNTHTTLQLYDATLTPTTAYTASALIAPNGLTWHPYGELLAVKMNNSTMQLFDCRAQNPVMRIADVSSVCNFDFDGAGNRLCMASEARKLAVFDLGQQRAQVTQMLCAKPGIIVNLGKDYFTVSCYDAEKPDYLLSVNINHVSDFSVQLKDRVTFKNGAADINVNSGHNTLGMHSDYLRVEKGASLSDMVVSKSTGQQLYHFRTPQKSVLAYVTPTHMFDTKISDPEPHNIACLYAFQKIMYPADLQYFKKSKNIAVLSDTSAKDSVFRQRVKAFSHDSKKS